MLKMTAIGNLTSDPQMRTNASTGKEYAIMRIASDRRYRDKDGNKYTDFISIKVYSPLAERCIEHLHKSDKIAATGDFETITTTQNGTSNTGFLMKANEVEFLSPRRRNTEEFSEEELADLPDKLELPGLPAENEGTVGFSHSAAPDGLASREALACDVPAAHTSPGASA